MDTIKKAALPRDLKSQNYREVLRIIGSEQQFTIAHLSEIVDISRQTIAKAVEYFIHEEVVIPSKKGSSTNVGGRKPQEYTLNTEKYIVAVSMYSRKMRFALLNFCYELVDTFDSKLTIGHSYQEFINEVHKQTTLLLEKNAISRESFYGIMVCIGGIIDSKAGVVKVTAVYSGWEKNVPLREDIQTAFGMPIQVCIGNVATTSASMLSLNKDVIGKRIAVVYLDYGIGITFLEDGKISETRHNVSGELGHMVLNMSVKTGGHCGDEGCWESLVYESSILREAEQLPPERRKLLFDGYNDREDFRIHLLRKCDEGNADARKMVDDLADIFGVAMRNIIFGFDPDSFVLIGSFSDWSEYFMERVKQVVRKNIYLSDLDISIQKITESAEDMMDKGSVNIMLQSFLDNVE